MLHHQVLYTKTNCTQLNKQKQYCIINISCRKDWSWLKNVFCGQHMSGLRIFATLTTAKTRSEMKTQNSNCLWSLVTRICIQHHLANCGVWTEFNNFCHHPDQCQIITFTKITVVNWIWQRNCNFRLAWRWQVLV